MSAIRVVARVLFVSLLAVVVSPIHAAQVVPTSIEDVVRDADAILRGTVVAERAHWGDASHRWIVTEYTFDVAEVIYGDVTRKTVSLRYWGGTLEGETQSISDVRLPVVGEQLIVALRPGWSTTLSFTPTVAMNYGLFSVDSTDGVRDATGAPILAEADGAALQAGHDAAAPAIQASAFASWVRDHVRALKQRPMLTPHADARDPRILPQITKEPSLSATIAAGDVALPAEDAGAPPAPSSSVVSIAAHTTAMRSASASPRPAMLRPNYVTFGAAYLPIVVNNFSSSFTPWSPEDQYQMSKWNYYDDIFRVYASPTNTYAWPDGVFDLDGWPSSADMQRIYGSAWQANVIGVTFTRKDGAGRIVEGDIALNPAFSYTLDDEWVYDNGPAQGFRQVMTHELGHMLGLDHQVNFLSVMNYMPQPFRAFAFPYMDDAQGARANYGGAITRTDLGIYLYYGSGYQSVSDAVYPSSVAAGSPLTVNYYHLENVGTTTVTTPTVQWYLSPVRNFNSTYYYIGTTTYPTLAPFNYFFVDTVSRTLTVPASVPPGFYYLAAFLPNDGGPGQSSFPFGNNFAFSRRSIRVDAAPSCSSFSISPSSASPGAASGSIDVSITGSPSGCTGGSWSASGNGSWLTVSPSSGSGSGSVTVSWAANASSSSRSATASIAGNSFGVMQAGASAPSCSSFQISPTSASPSYVAGSVSVLITGLPSGCQGGSWNAGGNGSWINVSATSGSGSGSVMVSWSQNGIGVRASDAVIAGNFFHVTQGSAPSGGRAVRADINHDGRSDIFWRNAATGETSIWFMNGPNFGSAIRATTVPVAWTPSVLGDFDGDGTADILWRNLSTGETSLWLGWNGSIFTTQVRSLNVPSTWTAVAAGDIDGDSRADIFWFNPSTGETSIWFMAGASVGSAIRSTTIPTSWRPLLVADFDNDGHADVFFQNPSTGETSVWSGWNGAGFTSQVRAITVPANWSVAGAGDFDGDGRDDIFWRNAVTGETSLWFMNGGSVLNAVRATTVTGWTPKWVGDFDGDAHSDVFWWNPSTGETSTWSQWNGAAFASQVRATTVPTSWTVSGTP